MRFLFITLLAIVMALPVYGQQDALRVLAWSHGVSPYGIEAASERSGATLSIDLYHSKEELAFYLSQHKTKPYDVLLLPEESVRALVSENALLPIGITHTYTVESGVTPILNYAALAMRDHLAVVNSTGEKASSWRRFFVDAKAQGRTLSVRHFSAAIDALMMANKVSPSRYSENDLMQVAKQMEDYSWSVRHDGDLDVVSYVESVHYNLDAYFPGNITRKTDYLYSVSVHSKRIEQSWDVVSALLEEASLAPLRYDGVSVFHHGDFRPPSAKVDSLQVIHNGAHTSQRMVKLKTIMESALNVSKR